MDNGLVVNLLKISQCSNLIRGMKKAEDNIIPSIYEFHVF